MKKPRKIVKADRNILAIISRGHPDRIMAIKTPKGDALVNPLTWSEIQVASNLPFENAGNCIAHLVGWHFIQSARSYPGFLKRLLGEEGITYFWITELGQKFLDEYSDASIPEKVILPSKEAMDTEDIEEAVRVYEDSFSPSPYTPEETIKWACSVLDEDIKEEIKACAIENENMWQQFEKRFGHRSGAKSDVESAFRDPVIKKTTKKMIRALDEQLKRKGLPASIKPPSWSDYYNDGEIKLDPPPWEKR